METAGTIAMFDDDEDILAICAYILEEKGWQVHMFTDCEDVEQRMLQIVPDMIFMDNRIPKGGGIAATQKLKGNAALKHIPVIFFSANSDIPLLAAEAGADSFLAKPFNLEQLDAAIANARLNGLHD